MSATCPVCTAPQMDGIACNTCTMRLERALADVAAIVDDLNVTLSRQSRIAAGGHGGLASERTHLHTGAMEAADDLTNTLTTWARDVTPKERTVILDCDRRRHPAVVAAHLLLTQVSAMRRHPAVAELMDEIVDAVERARREVDRPAERDYFGTCWTEHEGVTCTEELWAAKGADEVRCRVCGTEHAVAERRAWLLQQAADMLVTSTEAARFIGEVGRITVTEARIRGYLHRGAKLAYRPPVEAKRFRLGDLLQVVLDEGERRTA